MPIIVGTPTRSRRTPGSWKADQPDAAKAKLIRDFVAWMATGKAQEMATALGYAPLPGDVAALVRDRVKALKASGRPIG